MDSVLPPADAQARDVAFSCQHCAGSLIVDVAAAGLTLTCQHCGKPTAVPAPAESKADNGLADIQRKLKENESQRTEVTSYINQLSIQVHRWKLRLQTLNERKSELESELALLQK